MNERIPSRKPVLAGEVYGDRALLPELREDWDAWREATR
jgi:hypothetical protein